MASAPKRESCGEATRPAPMMAIFRALKAEGGRIFSSVEGEGGGV